MESEEPMSTEASTATLVNISPEKWPVRQRTYFGSLQMQSPQPSEVYACCANAAIL